MDDARRITDALLAAGLAGLMGLAAACSRWEDPDASAVRGPGLHAAALPPAEEARVDEAALRGAFDFGPSLILLLHPRRLPREGGLAGGAPVPGALVSALRGRGVVRGTCDPTPGSSARDTPSCDVPAAGYVVRVSDVLRVAPDTVQVFLRAERYAPTNGPKPEALRFEKIYRVAGRGGTWRAVGEARAHDSTP